MQSYTVTVSLDTQQYRQLCAAADAAGIPLVEYASLLLTDHAGRVSTNGQGGGADLKLNKRPAKTTPARATRR
jgi:hypothetical protein